MADGEASLELLQKQQRRLNWKALFWGLISGLGHIRLGYALSGAMFLCLFLVSVNALFLSRVLLRDPERMRQLFLISSLSSVTIWALSLADLWRRSFGRDRVALKQKRRDMLRQAQIAYLREDFDEALRVLRRAARKDYDWEDPAVFFHLAVVELRRAQQSVAAGRPRAAQRARRAASRAFENCLLRDSELAWGQEICRESQAAGLKIPAAIKHLMDERNAQS